MSFQIRDILNALVKEGERPMRVDSESELKMSREERIEKFNREAALCRLSAGAETMCAPTTTDYKQKSRMLGVLTLNTLSPVLIGELSLEKTHRDKAVFCRVLSDVMTLNASAVLVEDQSGITNLAVYGLDHPGDLCLGRRLAIVEPYYKTRADGSTGIRVDNVADIIFDVDPPETAHNASVHASSETFQKVVHRERLTVEDRLKSILRDDGTIGVNRIYHMLVDEGYDIIKKQIRALKSALKDDLERKTIPILSERRPEKHRLLTSSAVISCREKGNDAFQKGDFIEAEKQYSLALETEDSTGIAHENPVALWQLYGNRCAARLRMGMLDEAFSDSLMSNICAPASETKPILRCAEAMVALGLAKESDDLLNAAMEKFPDAAQVFAEKKLRLAPRRVFHVGQNQDLKTIDAAIQVAPADSEIIVDAGEYEELLILTKPLTIRSAISKGETDAATVLEDEDDSSWVEIHVNYAHAVVCALHNPNDTVRIIGCKIINDSPNVMNSLHALYVQSGGILLRHCYLRSSSGPVIAGQSNQVRMALYSCVVAQGQQGGILVCQDAKLTMRQVPVCYNAAAGLELREGGTACIDACHVYANGRQGLFIWKNAGKLIARDCIIHSQNQESGVMVSEGQAELERCRVFGNVGAGIVSQMKGAVIIRKCEVHDNLEGILIQDTGSARVENCHVHSNRANGIFIGYDHRGRAVVTDNEVHDNVCKGVLIGNKGKIDVRNNKEYGNKGLPPITPKFVQDRFFRSKSHLKKVQKNKETIAQAAREQKSEGFLDLILSSEQKAASILRVHEEIERKLLECANFEVQPGPGVTFAKCSVCRSVSYCSRACQKAHWPKHKKQCRPADVKYPSFVNQNFSI